MQDEDITTQEERKSLEIARKLIESLPQEYRSPDITTDDDGDVWVEWYQSPGNLINVLVPHKGAIYWVALLDSEEQKGSCEFSGQAPAEVVEILHRLHQKD